MKFRGSKNLSKIIQKSHQKCSEDGDGCWHRFLMDFCRSWEASWRQVGGKMALKNDQKSDQKGIQKNERKTRRLGGFWTRFWIQWASPGLPKTSPEGGLRLDEASWVILAVTWSGLGPLNWRLRRSWARFRDALDSYGSDFGHYVRRRGIAKSMKN